MNHRAISHDLFAFTTLMAILMFLASCGTPLPSPIVARPTPGDGMRAPKETATPAPTSAPTPLPFELRSGGVGLTQQLPDHGNQLLLVSPVDRVLYSVDWATLIASQDFKDLIAQPGCIDMVLVKPDRSEVGGPVSLGYSVPAVGQIFTPTLWSDLSLFDRAGQGFSALPITETQTIAAPTFEIDAVTAVTPANACDVGLIEDAIDDWGTPSGQDIQQADRILVTATQPDGSSTRVLIIVNPLSGASCEAAKTACSRCDGCGYEWVCTVVSWVCS